MTASIAALFDANVLYGARLRSLLMQLSMSGLFRARWSADIHREWMSAVCGRTGLSVEQLESTRAAMDEAVPDALVVDYQDLLQELRLPDPNDRHVLAAAIKSRTSVIVTFNARDFPAEILEPYGLRTQHPDDFILDLETLQPGVLIASVKADFAHYGNPPLSGSDYLGGLQRAGLVRVAEFLRENFDPDM